MRYLVTPQGSGLSTQSVFPAMSGAGQPATIRLMPIYLVEVHMAAASELELGRAVRMLDAAVTRMPESAIAARAIFAGHSREDGRLVCLIEAASLEAARRLVSLALLPPGRLREITRLSGDAATWTTPRRRC
jgi:hypothetical protein